MCSVESLREFVNERLTAAAEEILGVFKRTIIEYEEEIDRQRRLLDIVWKPEIKLHRTDLPQQHFCKDQQLCIEERKSSVDQEEPEPPEIKEEEEEVCSSQEGEQLVVKQETDGFMLTPADEESEHSEDQTLDFIHDDTQSAAEKESVVKMPVISSVISEATSEHQLLSHSSHVAESQDQTGGHHDNSHSNNVYNFTMSGIHLKTQAGKKSFKCDTCGKAFPYQSNLNIHLKIHTGEKPFTCTTCGKAFRRNCELKVHMRVHSGEKLHLCNTCGKRFSDKSALKGHIRIHTGEMPFMCTTCGKAFRLKSNLFIHMRHHTGERPFTCKTCGKAFIQKRHLTDHMRTHTGEKPFTCTTCGKAFGRKSHLTGHMRIHSGEKS